MALNPCPECGKEISENTAKCPLCGGITQKGKDRRAGLGVLLLVALVGGTIWFAMQPSPAKRYEDCRMKNLAHEYNHEPLDACVAP